MLKSYAEKPKVSHIQKTRMRYRGPIESIKINNFQQSLSRDIIEIDKKLKSSYSSLEQYITETVCGTDNKITICCDGNEVYSCNDNVAMPYMLSDNMPRIESSN